MNREIHAYENDDGTFRVKIFQSDTKTKEDNKAQIDTCQKSEIEIPRADINFICYDSNNIESDIFTIETRDQ